MPDDNPPISTTVPETTTIDTGADPESIATLKESFEDFWKDQDEGQPETKAPEAPGPAQETKPAKELAPAAEKPAAKVEHGVAPKEKTTVEEPPKEYIGEDIDKFELPASARPEHQEQFKKIKELWKADQRKVETEIGRSKQLERELAEARANQLTPEMKADYEHAANIRRRFDFASDPEFLNKFQLPLIKHYQDTLDEAASMLDDPNEGARWAAYVKSKWQTPDELGSSVEEQRKWWSQSVIDKIPDRMNRDLITAQVNKLYGMQKDRNAEIHNRTNDQASYSNWIQERNANRDKWTADEIKAEIGIQEQRFKEVLPVDVSKAKTKEERAAMEEHNERFTKLNDFFVNTMNDMIAHGPKAWVRAAVEATRTQVMNQQIINLEKENKEVRAERDQLKADLEKINGARRRIAQTAGTPPTPTGVKPQQNGQGLSIKDLDVRKSFRNFDWGDGS